VPSTIPWPMSWNHVYFAGLSVVAAAAIAGALKSSVVLRLAAVSDCAGYLGV